ncbi:MAG: hypothetical protein ACI4U4_04245 [Bacilli bacterium]
MRINRKGFMLAEVIIVSVIICVVLVSLFTGINRVTKAYDLRNRYYDVNALYMAEKANLYLIEDKSINNLISDDTPVKVENSNLNEVISFYNSGNTDSVVNIYFTPYDQTNLESLKDKGTNQTYKDFIDYLSGHLEFNGEYTYMLISEICNSTDDCYYYGLGVK